MASILLVQEVVETAAGVGGGFEPVFLGLIVLLPLIGFLINGSAAIIAARRGVTTGVPDANDPAHANHDSHHPHHAGDDDHTDAHGHDSHGGHDDHGPAGELSWTHRLPTFVAPGVLAIAFGLALVNFFRMTGAELHGPVVVSFWDWIPVGDLRIPAALQLDQLSILMTLIITGVGTLIHLFSVGYMSQDPGYPRYMAYLNLFVFFMLVLVLGSSFPAMFVGWEGVGLCSYLLIGFWFKEKANADAGKKAFIVNRVGDFGFLIAMFLIFSNLGSLSYGEVFEAASGLQFGGAVVTTICLFLLLGATGKSAQIPLYVWLPDAMAGPTPVSALIHAATMVTAGVYLVVRSSTLFAMAPTASLVVALIGAFTAVFAATIGLKQWDIKKVLAYSTVSQLGFMFAAVGMGAYVAGVFHLMTHAFFKACLFLGSGAVIHAMHHALHATHSDADAQDMRNMGGLRKFMPVTFATMGIATLAIAGVPPFSGFFSKDEIVGAAWIGLAGGSPMSSASLFGIPGTLWMGLIAVLLSAAAFMTAFYMGRLMIYTFFGPNRTGEQERKHLHEVEWTLTVPLIVLAALSTIGGLFNVDAHVPIVNWFSFAAIGGDSALHRWLHPVIEGAEQVWAANIPNVGEVHHAAWPIVLAIVIGLAGLGLAWVMLKPDQLGTPEETPAYRSPLEKALYNKWYIDELYGKLVIGPVQALSRVFYTIVDRSMIDGIIDRVLGRGAMSAGLFAGRTQSGYINTYAFIIVIGVLVVLGAVVGRL
jgi:NADH-quinone oxidoreductase subunit L